MKEGDRKEKKRELIDGREQRREAGRKREAGRRRKE